MGKIVICFEMSLLIVAVVYCLLFPLVCNYVLMVNLVI